ncbi:hypothetical protein ABEB36_000970 [Hypothenemus hampei]|uniref:F-box domain-containing protein n=1 Tax=Hypothenemus hampei TaxID=57062 RepID=A0ABD1FD10_HYPHA
MVFFSCNSCQKMMLEPKRLKSCNSNCFQLYARADAPSRDYYGLTVTESSVVLNVWNISYGARTFPKQKRCSIDELKQDKAYQDQIRRIFGVGVFDYVIGLSKKTKKFENLPWKLFIDILKFLNVEDILRLMRCSKIFYELCNQDVVWRLLFTKKFARTPSNDEQLLACEKTWREVLKNRLTLLRSLLKSTTKYSTTSKMKPLLDKPSKKIVHNK